MEALPPVTDVPRRTPPFAWRQAGGWTILAQPDWAGAIAEALASKTTLDKDAAGSWDTHARGGRGPVQRFEGPDGPAILRPTRRGGLLGGIQADRFVTVNRPLWELRIHCHAYTQDLPLPEPIGAYWRRTTGLLQGGFISREASGAIPLHMALQQGAGPELCRAAGVRIRQMHDAGVWHADLNAGNILVTARGPMLIDFDKAQVRFPLGGLARSRNLLRLERSWRKWRLPAEGFVAILDGYGAIRIPGWLQWLYDLRSASFRRNFGEERRP